MPERKIIFGEFTPEYHEAFYQNITITGLEIPSSVTSVASFAFTGCANLTEFTTDPSNPNFTTVDGVLFNKDKSMLVTYPAGKVGEYIIPKTTTNIGAGAFSSCTKLTGITIPNTITNIGGSAFHQCSSLDSINIPSTVYVIGNGAFAECTGLKSITANAVTPVVFNTLSNVFSNINKDSCTLYVPNGLTSSYQNANLWKDFLHIIGPSSTGLSVNNLLSIYLYPTMAIENFTVNGLENVAKISLTDLNGKVVCTKLVHNGDRISVGALPKGVYLAKINIDNGCVERKIVKQ